MGDDECVHSDHRQAGSVVIEGREQPALPHPHVLPQAAVSRHAVSVGRVGGDDTVRYQSTRAYR